MRRESSKDLAMVITKAMWPEYGETHFFTPLTKDYPLQVALIGMNEHEIKKAHYHPSEEGEGKCMHELLMVLEGRIRLDIYNIYGEKRGSKVLTRGDSALVMEGHGIKAISNSVVMMIKQEEGNKVPEKIVLED